MATEQDQLQAGIAALESQRALLGDAVAEAALAPLRARLATLAEVQHAPAVQTLRQVTILFLDVVGSTALSQRLDPEDIHFVLDGALARLSAIVKSHRGKVLQYAGDSLLAIFGADEAREDDPERAVRCGLALLTEGRALMEEIQRSHGHEGFDVRVGLHTGSVLLGGGVDAEGSIRGIAVSIAARMEQTAPAGSLRISRDTYRHVRGLFAVQAQPPIPIKGLDEPFITYLVLHAKPRTFRTPTRGIEGVETRMVGRDAELEQLREAFKALYQERKLIAVTVVGEAGVGKSRLLYEFESWTESQPGHFTIFQGRATPQMHSDSYGVLRDILAWRLQIADSDSIGVAKQKIEQGIAPLFAADDGEDIARAHAHILGHLIGLDFGDSKHVRGIRDDGKQMRDRGFHVAAQMFRRVAAYEGVPIVLLLEDLHWADAGSQDFLTYLCQINRDVPMLVVGLTRPTLLGRFANWLGSADVHRIDLGPLDEGASRLLASELLKKLPEVPAALHTLITGGAEGNPFYMEELVNMLVDHGAIEAEPERWTLHPERLLATHVPQTITGVLQARLDALPAAERTALQDASVIGFVFWDQALAAIDPQASLSLPALVQRALTLPRQSTSLEGMREYVFRHQILHHVTYDTLLKRSRCELHAKVAAWLAAVTDVRANDFFGVIAEHFEKAGDRERAVEFYTRAAEHAKARYGHEAALRHVARALALIGADDFPDAASCRWRLIDARERMLDLQGRRSEQLVDIDSLQRLADALDDDNRRAEVAWRRCDFALGTADFPAAVDVGRLAMTLAERAGAVELGLRAQCSVTAALCMVGDGVSATALARDGLAAARSLGLRHLESRFLKAHYFLPGAEDNPMVPLELSQQILLIEHEIGDRSKVANASVDLGMSWLELGEPAQARRHLEEGRRLMQAVGDLASESYALNGLACLAMWQGDDALALAHAQAALDIAIAVQDRFGEGLALQSLGRAELRLGRYAAAKAAFERAHAAALSTDSRACYNAMANMAQVALAEGDVAGALRAVEGVLAHMASGGTLAGYCVDRHFIRLSCYQVLERALEPRAAEMLTIAHTELQASAARITDATLRHNFLNNIPENREIVAAWEAHQAAPAGPQ
jgi:class 3 adenylate cyclase/tetratricopeptide (TPR) repeat protein